MLTTLFSAGKKGEVEWASSRTLVVLLLLALLAFFFLYLIWKKVGGILNP